MKINIKATKVELTPKVREYVQKKMDMIDKYLGGITATNCDVEIAMAIGSQQKGEIYRCEANLEVPGELLRVEKTEKELYKAIDKVKDHLARAVKRYKEKMIEKKRRTE